MKYRAITFLLALLLSVNNILPAIIAQTLVKTPYGHEQVETITPGSVLVGYDNNTLTNVIVTSVHRSNIRRLIRMSTSNGVFDAPLDQQFFDPINKSWIFAHAIKPQTVLLDSALNYCICLEVETISIEPTAAYHISTTAPHNFFSSKCELLTHNAFPVVIGLAWLFGEGIKFAGITLGTSLLGGYIGLNLYNKHKNSSRNIEVGCQIIAGGYNPDPNDGNNNENERKHNTISKSEFSKK